MQQHLICFYSAKKIWIPKTWLKLIILLHFVQLVISEILFRQVIQAQPPPILWFNSISQILVNILSLHMIVNTRWCWFSENFYNSKFPNCLRQSYHCNCHIWFTARQVSLLDENVAIDNFQMEKNLWKWK
jgi:hypothetical protein